MFVLGYIMICEITCDEKLVYIEIDIAKLLA
jgi:hypothetical protein